MNAHFTSNVLCKQKLMHLFKWFFQVLFDEDLAADKVAEYTPSSIRLGLQQIIDVVILIFIVNLEQFYLRFVNGFSSWMG